VGGLDEASKDHPERVIRCALEMLEAIKLFELRIRAGAHTGPVVAGVIGKTKFSFDLWGDSVNYASRMESTGVPGKIQISRTVYERVHDIFEVEERQGVQVKGKGMLTTYIVQGEKGGAQPPIMAQQQQPVAVAVSVPSTTTTTTTTKQEQQQ